MIPPLAPFPLPLLLPFFLPHDLCGSSVLAWPGGGPPFVGHGGRALASPDGLAVEIAGFGVGFGVGRGVGRAVGVGVRTGVGLAVGAAVGRAVDRAVGAAVAPPVGALVGFAPGCWLGVGAGVAAGATFGGGEAAALAGDGIAVEVVATIGRRLGVALSSFANIFEPDVIVIGGGVAAAGELLLGPAREQVRSRALPPMNETPVRPAELGPEAGMIGAAEMALEEAA